VFWFHPLAPVFLYYLLFGYYRYKVMRLFRRHGWILLWFLLMGAAGWLVFRIYEAKLHIQWGKRAVVITQRLSRSLQDTQLELGILGESIGSQMKGSPKDFPAIEESPVMKRLGVREVVWHGADGDRLLFGAVAPASLPKTWRASLFDFSRTNAPQAALELTDHGPRVLDIEPVTINGSICGLEVASDFQNFLADFSRREGVEMAYLVSESRAGDASLPTIEGPSRLRYRLLSASSRSVDRVLKRPEIQKYIGQAACGLSITSNAAFAVLMLDNVEYSSSKVPATSGASALVIWEDYSDEVSAIVAGRHTALWITWALMAVFGGVIAYILHYRRQSRRREMGMDDALRRANEKLQLEVKTRQTAEERLRGIADEMYAAREADRELLSYLSHQMKLNASADLGFVELIKNESPRKGQAESLDALHQLGEQMLFMAENLGLWSRRAMLEVSMSRQTLKAVVNRAVQRMAAVAARKGIAVEADIGETIALKADGVLLEMAVKNLLSNAIKFSVRGTKVVLGARTLENGIEFSISDSGQGIGREVMEKVFEPARKILRRGTEGEEGMGFGLSLVKWICDLHGAQLRIASDEGMGCRVTILFPLS